MLDPLRAPGRGSCGRVGALPGLDLRLLIGADHVLAGVQQSALPATLVEVEHRAGALQEPGVAWKHPRAVLPRLQRVFGEPARDRGRRRLRDAALDHQPMKLSPREPRDRYAKLARQLARDRLDLRYLFRGENGAGDPRAACPLDPPGAPAGTVFATSRRPPAPCRAAPRSPHSSVPAPRRARSWPAAQSETAPSAAPRSPRAQHVPRRSARSHRSCGGPCQQIRLGRHNSSSRFANELTTATT